MPLKRNDRTEKLRCCVFTYCFTGGGAGGVEGVGVADGLDGVGSGVTALPALVLLPGLAALLGSVDFSVAEPVGGTVPPPPPPP